MGLFFLHLARALRLYPKAAHPSTPNKREDEHRQSQDAHLHLLLKGRHILFPLKREHSLFLIIALLAGWYQIRLDTSPPPSKRDNMIHGKILGAILLPAIIADSRPELALPPTTLPQLLGLGPFLTDDGLVHA